jgi:trigger factor
LEPLMDKAYRELSNSIKIPGFRKGKIPKQVIDSHIGRDQVRSEAVRNGIYELYLLGIEDSGILPVSDPKLDIVDMDDEGKMIFEAVVEVKPEVEVKNYKGLVVKKQDTSVSDEDIDQAIEEIRERFATLEIVDARPIAEGDFVLFDYKVFAENVPVEDASGTDQMLEIGSNDFLEGFDEQLVGARKGDIIDVTVKFPETFQDASMAGKPATFRTIIKEIKKKMLPPLNDELAKEASQFETLDELKADLRPRLEKTKEMFAERESKNELVEIVVDQTEVDLPEGMVDRHIEDEIHGFEHELNSRGITLDEYLYSIQGTRDQLKGAVMENVKQSLKGELVLEAVAKAENLEVSDDEVEEYIRENATNFGGDPEGMIEMAKSSGRISAIKSQVLLAKAVDVLVENAVFEESKETQSGEDDLTEQSDEESSEKENDEKSGTVEEDKEMQDNAETTD